MRRFRDAALRRRSDEGSTSGVGEREGTLGQRVGERVRPQAKAVQKAGLRHGGLRAAEGEGPSRVQSAQGTVQERTHHFTKNKTEPHFVARFDRLAEHQPQLSSSVAAWLVRSVD